METQLTKFAFQSIPFIVALIILSILSFYLVHKPISFLALNFHCV